MIKVQRARALCNDYSFLFPSYYTLKSIGSKHKVNQNPSIIPFRAQD